MDKIFRKDIQRLDSEVRQKAFMGCKFEYEDYDPEIVEEVAFVRCSIEGASFVGTKFKTIRFIECDVLFSDFGDSEFDTISFEGCELYGNSFRSCSFSSVKFENSFLGDNGYHNVSWENLEGLVLRKSFDHKNRYIVYDVERQMLFHPLFAGRKETILNLLRKASRYFTLEEAILLKERVEKLIYETG